MSLNPNHNAPDTLVGRDCYDSAGNRILPDASGNLTLAPGTYYLPVGNENAQVPSVTALIGMHLKWSAALAATITIELCNFPKSFGPPGGAAVDVVEWDATAGNWIQANAAADGRAAVVGTGNSATVLALTAGGTNAGGAFVTMPDMGARRVRFKIVVTTGGTLRMLGRGKVAA